MLLVQLMKRFNSIHDNLLLQLSNYILVFIFTFLVNNKTDCTTIKYYLSCTSKTKCYWCNLMLLVKLMKRFNVTDYNLLLQWLNYLLVLLLQIYFRIDVIYCCCDNTYYFSSVRLSTQFRYFYSTFFSYLNNVFGALCHHHSPP
jgi:hypothetical protein